MKTMRRQQAVDLLGELEEQRREKEEIDRVRKQFEDEDDLRCEYR